MWTPVKFYLILIPYPSDNANVLIVANVTQ